MILTFMFPEMFPRGVPGGLTIAELDRWSDDAAAGTHVGS